MCYLFKKITKNYKKSHEKLINIFMVNLHLFSSLPRFLLDNNSASIESILFFWLSEVILINNLNMGILDISRFWYLLNNPLSVLRSCCLSNLLVCPLFCKRIYNFAIQELSFSFEFCPIVQSS